VPIVTITGQAGSGGPEIGRRVADLLGVDYVDREILAEAARRIKAPVAEVEKRDEKTSSLGKRIARFLQSFLEKSAIAGAPGDPFMGSTGIEVLLSRTYAEEAQSPASESQQLDDTRFCEVIQAVIRDLAKTGNVVIIGRGGQVILRNIPSATHAYLTASLEDRIKLTVLREGIDQEKAEKNTKETDKNLTAYYKKFFKVDYSDPLLYHLIVNTSLVAFDTAAHIIATFAKDKGATPEPI